MQHNYKALQRLVPLQLQLQVDPCSRLTRIIAAIILVTSITAYDADGSAGCSADLNTDGVVNGADIATLLAGWGLSGKTDLDGSGITDGADLASLLADWGECPKPPTTFIGTVIIENGASIDGAVVVSNLGGAATSAEGGWYQLEVALRSPVQAVMLSATVAVDGATYQGSFLVDPVTIGEVNQVDPIIVAPIIEDCPVGLDWAPGFAEPGMNDSVYALASFDDGSGPVLYAGGSFTKAGGPTQQYIARWVEDSWVGLGVGVNGSVRSLAVFDDGEGPALYVGGTFTSAGGVEANFIARWNGKAWSPLGEGTNGPVHALATFDDGTGLALYVGGEFTDASGVAANYIARWDGSSWVSLGVGMGGVNPYVHALAVFDDGAGNALYAGGYFTAAGANAANFIARWDGESWSSVGGGVNSNVRALEVFDGGDGPELYVGGEFTSAGGMSVSNVARWTGGSWRDLEGGVSGGGASSVRALRVINDDMEPRLYVGGSFTNAGGLAASRIARWDGKSWSTLGSGFGPGSAQVRAICGFDRGGGVAVYAGGQFAIAGPVTVNHIAEWSRSSWSALGGGLSGGDAVVSALAVVDLGSGPSLYVGGSFTSGGGLPMNRIARWDGGAWIGLGSGLSGAVRTMAVFDDGSGEALYAGGEFYNADGVVVKRIARWNGVSWMPVGNGVDGPYPAFPHVAALAVFDDGSGPSLYAAGGFSTAGGTVVNNIARWNGTAWSALGSGMAGGLTGVATSVDALAVYDDGTGPALYAGGNFTTAGGVNVNYIARWDGTSWSAVGAGMSGRVYALAAFDNGLGPSLYAGGAFVTAGGVTVNRIAQWNGMGWAALGSGVNSHVRALAVFDDGAGPVLVAGGFFGVAGGVPCNRIARWDGAAWAGVGSGLNSNVRALSACYDAAGASLYVGGQFTQSGNVNASRIAHWRCGDP